MRRRATTWRAVACAALVLLAGCGSYEGLFQYTPAPAQVVLAGTGTEDVADGILLAAVEGLRTVGQGPDLRYVFDVRVRIDHRSDDEAWTFDPATARLVTGSLVALELLETTPSGPISLPSNTTSDAELAFALPVGAGPDDLELDRLHLTLRLQRPLGDGVITAGFERRVQMLASPDHWGWGAWHDPWYPYGWYPYGYGARVRVVRPRRRR